MATAPVHVAVGDLIKAADHNNEQDWWGGSFATYTPSLLAVTTNPTLGTGSSVYGRYVQIGKLVIAVVAVNFGTSGTNAGSGNYSISLPVTPATPSTTITIGHGRLISAGVGKFAQAVLTSGGVQAIKYEGGGNSNASNTQPGAWTANDSLWMTYQYEAA